MRTCRVTTRRPSANGAFLLRLQALEDGGGGKKAQALRKLAEAQSAAKAKRKDGNAEAPKAAGGRDSRLQARLAGFRD